MSTKNARVLVMKGLPGGGELLKKWAAAKNVELIDASSVTSTTEFVKLSRDHEVNYIVNTFAVSQMGGWTNEVVQNLPPSVKAVCSFGAGYDSLGDLERFKKRGIQISNTPNGVAQATADTGVYLILGALRNFNGLAASLRAGNFLGDVPLADEYDGKTLGILGLGGIGGLVRDKVKGAFDFAKIQYHNRRRQPAEIEKDSVYVSFDELISTSDVILSVLPLTSSTHHLFNKETLAKTKKGAIIVNIGRGPVVDEEALVEALESGHLSTVGLDVYEHEPKIHPKLLANENAMLLPHVGTHTTVARSKMLREIADNIESHIETGNVVSLLPELR